jgi:hypothetical protein
MAVPFPNLAKASGNCLELPIYLRHLSLFTFHLSLRPAAMTRRVGREGGGGGTTDRSLELDLLGLESEFQTTHGTRYFGEGQR